MKLAAKHLNDGAVETAAQMYLFDNHLAWSTHATLAYCPLIDFGMCWAESALCLPQFGQSGSMVPPQYPLKCSNEVKYEYKQTQTKARRPYDVGR